MKIYTADFETTTEETCKDETWVWAWGTRELFKENSFRWGTDLNDFMSFCADGAIKDSKMIYFHNLKFDGFFLLSWLLNNGVKWVPNKKMINGKPKKTKDEVNTFKTMITKEGLFYSIEWVISRNSKNVKKVIFRDSLKKLPFTIDRIAKAFKLPMLKGSIDYRAIRPKGYKPSKKEIDYLRNDVEIAARALEIQINEGQSGMTIGSDSLAKFKEIIGDNTFKRLFPVLPDKDNEIIRKAYKGGFTYLNPKYKDVIVACGRVYDVNSLYPAMMLKPMPYGTPIKFKGKYEKNNTYPLYIQTIVCEFTVREGMIPTIQVKDDPRFKATEYLTSSRGLEVELTLTGVDYELFMKHYDVIVYVYRGGYMFKQIEGIFSDYIKGYMKIKETSEGAIRELAKLLLNNLYGKFSTDTDATPKIPIVDREGVVHLIEPEKNDLLYTKDSIYTAVGAYITAYARETTITACQNNYDRFIYADTDSLHVEGEAPVTNIDVHPTKIGCWDYEAAFIKGKFIRAKTYMEAHIQKEVIEDGKRKVKRADFSDYDRCTIKITCAGMPDNVKKKVTFKNFEVGATFSGKLKPTIVKGGVILIDTDFTIKN